MDGRWARAHPKKRTYTVTAVSRLIGWSPPKVAELCEELRIDISRDYREHHTPRKTLRRFYRKLSKEEVKRIVKEARARQGQRAIRAAERRSSRPRIAPPAQ